MNDNNKKTLIGFPGGSYGNFLQWCFIFFNKQLPQQNLPFTQSGSSHNYQQPLSQSIELKKYIEAVPLPLIHARHIKTEQSHVIHDILCEIYKKTNVKIFYIQPNIETDFALVSNNIFDKQKAYKWKCLLGLDPTIEKLKLWPNNDLWAIREKLSYYLFDARSGEWGLNEKLKDNDCYKLIHVRDIFKNFETVIRTLVPADCLRNTDKIHEIENKWTRLQKHKDKDKNIKYYVDSVLQNKSYIFNDMTLIDEAIIQYYLRENNIEIECVNLNKFPTNSIDLAKLTYYI